MSNSTYMTMSEILDLYESIFKQEITSSAIYKFIERKDFPQNIGIGSPRLWVRKDVEAWFEQFIPE